eukprot:SAG22_NODE_1685_length_3810_cov_28.206413_5_plen_53_part_00
MICLLLFEIGGEAVRQMKIGDPPVGGLVGSFFVQFHVEICLDKRQELRHVSE